MTKIIAICNQKGGVGKTSTAVSLSSCLAMEGKKSLLIDLDPQGNATSGLGIDKTAVQKSIYYALLGESSLSQLILESCVTNLFIIPSNENLSGSEVELVGELGREGKLKKALSQLDPSFEFVIIDCPPSLGLLTVNALTGANSVLIPIQCEYYALEGLGQLMKTINLIKDNLNSALEIEGILMTMADYRTNLTQQVIEEVKKHFGEKVYNTIIPRNIRLSEAPGFGKPIFLYDKDSEGAKKYKEFTKEFLLFNVSS
ncbi:MAG: sporulation initiation inhibitor Soj [Candidatus Omnitrophica bacterium CG07_land_8_20_14_0_80_50_8]|nr:MAG: sporulation initiation inhibitor Soj [Candidatus Omnitrophica bacterium CG1_02_49_16]PIU39837.1 MAG: sporulation initiation inhibitor Soj [Candidatus Omnitrophica bacterium CG07_land_8_20_14_0_80_50_8]